MTYLKFVAMASTALAGCCIAGPAFAQSATGPAAATAEKEGSEIVVTAQKREQTLIDVPQSISVVSGIERPVTSDELKHFGAALASFGSVAMFHMPGVTPEAHTLTAAFGGRTPPVAQRIGRSDFDSFFASYAARGDKVDVVVFAAPQLSIIELQRLADLLDGRRVAEGTTLIAATSPENKFAADRMGLTTRIEAANGVILLAWSTTFLLSVTSRLRVLEHDWLARRE